MSWNNITLLEKLNCIAHYLIIDFILSNVLENNYGS